MGVISDAWERAKDWASDRQPWEWVADAATLGGYSVVTESGKEIARAMQPDIPADTLDMPEEDPPIGGGGSGGGDMIVEKPPNPDSAGQYLGETLEEEEAKRKKISKKKLGTRALQIPLNVPEASPTEGLGSIDTSYSAGLRI
jgi:hypothetical protein